MAKPKIKTYKFPGPEAEAILALSRSQYERVPTEAELDAAEAKATEKLKRDLDRLAEVMAAFKEYKMASDLWATELDRRIAGRIEFTDSDYWPEYDGEKTITVGWSNPYCVSKRPPTYYRADGKDLVHIVCNTANDAVVTKVRPAGKRAVLRAEDLPPHCVEHKPRPDVLREQYEAAMDKLKRLTDLGKVDGNNES